MLIGVLVIVAVAGVFGLVTEESSDDTAGEVVRIYGDAIGVSADEWREIRAEALEWANVVCSTEPAEFFETWTDAVPGRDAAIEVAEVRCVDLVRSFAKDGVQP